MNQRIFEGLHILDLSTVLAGPSVASFFAELGAYVIKIENPTTSGDVTRSWKLPMEETQNNVSAYFSSVNYGKNYVWLDISKSENRKVLEDLIRKSDVLICNFKKGDDQKFSLTASDVFALQPQIIYSKITGYEYESERIAYDVVLQAENGYMAMNGTPESGPVKMPVAMIDVIAAHQLKEGILCALLERAKTNRGSVVECSLEKAGLSALVNQASNYLMTSHVAERIGSLHPNISPYGEIFYCKDEKPLVLAIGSDRQFATLTEILGSAQLSSDDRFRHNQDRVKNRTELAKLLSPIFKTKNRNNWVDDFIKKNVPAGAIKTMDEVLSGRVAKEMLLSEEISGVKTKRLSSVAFNITTNQA